MSNILASKWSLHLFYKNQNDNTNEQYENNVHLIGTFNTVQDFWSYYSHLKRPNELEIPSDYHLFREGVRAIWEDDVNVNGGKWMIRLKKGLASYYWERLIIALIGEQFPVDVVGAVVSVRFQEDIISLWNKTGNDAEIRHEICCDLCSTLELPPDTKLEYKKHDESVKDHSSFKNTVLYQAGKNHPFEVKQNNSNTKSPTSPPVTISTNTNNTQKTMQTKQQYPNNRKSNQKKSKK